MTLLEAQVAELLGKPAASSLRTWRKRMGGTLVTMTPYAVGGLLGRRGELPRTGECADCARMLAAGLPGCRAAGARDPGPPAVPGTCTCEVHADGVVEEVNERLLTSPG